MPTKTELISFLEEKKKVKKEEIEKVWTQKEAEVKEAGVTDKELAEKMVMQKVSLYFRKLATGTSTSQMQVVFVGAGAVTDYGARKKFDEARRVFEQDPNKAVSEGWTNEAGAPLWRGSKLTSKNGKLIQPEKETSRPLYCLAFRPDQDSTWKPGILNLSGDQTTWELPEFGKLYEIEAVVARATKEKWNGERIIMYAGKDTSIKEPKEAPKALNVMLQEYGKSITIKCGDIMKWSRQDGAAGDFFVTKANVVRSNETTPGNSNIIEFSDPEDLLFDEDSNYTGWISEDVPLNIVDEATDVYIIGKARTYMGKAEDGTEEEKLQLEVFGFLAHPSFLRTEENTPKIGNEGQDQKVIEEDIVINDDTTTDDPGKIDGW